MRFADLLAHPGVVEEFAPGSTFGVMAFHGGSLERMTDVVATEVAARSGASLYAVRQPDDLRWHLPSSEVDPAASDVLRAFLEHVDVALAFHGYGRAGQFTTLLAGGSNRPLAAGVAAALRPVLRFEDTTYDVIDDLAAIPVELRGLHPDNPVNRVRHGGVQLELPPRVRGLGPYWEGRPPSVAPIRTGVSGSARQNRLSLHTEAMIEALAGVAATWCETPAP